MVRKYSNSTVVSVPYDSSNREELVEWLRDNSKGEVEVHPAISFATAEVLFEFEDDATFFSLRWG